MTFEPTFETTTRRLVLRRPTDADRAFHSSVHSDPRGVKQDPGYLNLYYRFVAEAQGRGLAREEGRAAVAMARRVDGKPLHQHGGS